MKAVFDSDKVKGSFFLTTLPDSMDTIIDNLSTGNITTFKQIELKMLDIHEKHQIGDDSTAYWTATNRDKNKKNKANNRLKGNQANQPMDPSDPKECTYYKKHGHKYDNHTHRNCYRLQKDRKKNKKDDRKKTKSNTANVAREASDKDTASEPEPESVAFSAIAPSNVCTAEDDIEPSTIAYAPFTDLSLHAMSSDPSSTLWVFDIGASSHMTG